MVDWFAVDHLDVGRLLAEWRWLCPNVVSLIARNAFGDLFLRDGAGQIHRLDVGIAKLLKVADSEAQFRELATSKREEWFAESDEVAAAVKGLNPNPNQCIGFAVPLLFRTSSASPNNPYVPAAWTTFSSISSALAERGARVGCRLMVQVIYDRNGTDEPAVVGAWWHWHTARGGLLASDVA